MTLSTLPGKLVAATNPARAARLLYVPTWDTEKSKEIAARIRQARHAAGLSRDDVSDLLRVHRKTVANWESPSRPTYPGTKLPALARALKTTPEWLLYGDEVVTEQDLRTTLEQQRDVMSQLLSTLKRLERRLGDD